jgi:hypothetical protein
MVSTNGSAIIDISEEFFDLDSLLADENPDTSFLEKKLAEMHGFDETKFQDMRGLYASMPNNEQIRSLYRDALTEKYVHLSILEDIAWARVGFTGKKAPSAVQMLTHAQDMAEIARNELIKAERKLLIKRFLPATLP